MRRAGAVGAIIGAGRSRLFALDESWQYAILAAPHARCLVLRRGVVFHADPRRRRRYRRREVGSRCPRRNRPGSTCRAGRELVADFGKEVTRGREDDELAAGQHLHELARLGREDLVVLAVEEEHGCARPGSASSHPADWVASVTTPRQCVAETVRPGPRPRRRTSGPS